jgi:hypothetical protein
MSTFSSDIHLSFTRVAQARAMYSDNPVCRDVRFPFESQGPSEVANRVQANVARWYGEMTPYWTTLAPSVRKRLVLRVHQWIAETAFIEGVLRADVMDDLGPGGVLTLALTEVIPLSERERWRPWVRATLRDLRRTLGSPPGLQTEAWWRQLFLGSCNTPAPAWRPTRLRSV